MMTTLEEYRELQRAFADPAGGNPETLFFYMELLYRIQILENVRYLEQAAPVSMDLSTLGAHYGAMDALVSHLFTERRYRPSQEEVQQARDTARQVLASIITDYRKRFSAYMPEAPEQYKTDITKVINTVLPAWLAYRESMLAIHN